MRRLWDWIVGLFRRPEPVDVAAEDYVELSMPELDVVDEPLPYIRFKQ